jgi:putative hemolysin
MEGAQIGQRGAEALDAAARQKIAMQIGDRPESLRVKRKVAALRKESNDDDTVNLVKIADSPHSRIPVCRGDIDVIVGVLCKKEYLKALLTGATTDIESLVKPVPFVTIYTTTLELHKLFV